MVRVKCVIQYDGSSYFGSQVQVGLPTVMGEIQKALKKIHKKDIIVTSAGRTDAHVGNLRVWLVRCRNSLCKNAGGLYELRIMSYHQEQDYNSQYDGRSGTDNQGRR